MTNPLCPFILPQFNVISANSFLTAIHVQSLAWTIRQTSNKDPSFPLNAPLSLISLSWLSIAATTIFHMIFASLHECGEHQTIPHEEMTELLDTQFTQSLHLSTFYIKKNCQYWWWWWNYNIPLFIKWSMQQPQIKTPSLSVELSFDKPQIKGVSIGVMSFRKYLVELEPNLPSQKMELKCQW